MKSLKTVALFFAAGAGVHLWADANADALQKLAQLPSAPMIITIDQAAGSPSVVLTDKGALINKSTAPVPFDQILSKLAALPASAWPYGRVLLYSSSGAAGYAAPPKPIADKVESDLQQANIRLLRQ